MWRHFKIITRPPLTFSHPFLPNKGLKTQRRPQRTSLFPSYTKLRGYLFCSCVCFTNPQNVPCSTFQIQPIEYLHCLERQTPPFGNDLVPDLEPFFWPLRQLGPRNGGKIGSNRSRCSEEQKQGGSSGCPGHETLSGKFDECISAIALSARFSSFVFTWNLAARFVAKLHIRWSRLKFVSFFLQSENAKGFFSGTFNRWR